MRLLRGSHLQQLLKLTLILGSVWILTTIGAPKTGWDLTYIYLYSWLEYTDGDGSMEELCNCSAILQGDREALELAKTLTTNKAFQKSVQIPDEQFKRSRKYLTFPLSQEEEDFPLAYSMVVHHKNTGKQKDPPPFNLPILSGNAYIVVNRGYIRSVLEDKRILALIEWAKDTYSPDEFLWATIQRIPGVPGSTRPNCKYDMTDINAIARLVKWEGHEGPEGSLETVYPECQGKHVRELCVYGSGDLQWMLEYHHLFANKFDIDTDPVAIYCLEKYLRQKALAEFKYN